MSAAPAAGLRIEHRLGPVCAVKLSGVINETFDGKRFVAGLSGNRAPLAIDLDEVRSITSFGVREWVNALKALPSEYYCFVRCRPAVLVQFNMVSGFGGRGEIVSFFIPYHCGACGNDFELLADLRTQHAKLSSYDIPGAPCPKCQAAAEFDDLPESYLAHVAQSPAPNPPPAVVAWLDGVAAPVPFRVEKEVKGNLTALWAHGTLDKSARLRRIVDGLEGSVALVAAGIETADAAGVSSLRPLFDAASTTVWVARAPVALIQAIGGAFGKAKLASILAAFRCSGCQATRTREIDLEYLHDAGPARDLCPSCGKGTEQPVAEAFQALVEGLPLAAQPKELRSYLVSHPNGPSTVKPAEAGASLGKYEIVRRIGIGGMAEIFLARQVGPEGFEKKVVLKRILPQLAADEKFVEMFFDEARIAALLSHPNVVQIFDLGRQGEQHFIAMEYVRGADLNAVLRACRDQRMHMPVELACRIVADVCAGLHAAHSSATDDGRPLHIVHRDVSPHNVLLSVDGSVKLTDFGIAKAVHSISSTRPGTLKGKICYMSPEQAEGVQAIDGRSDLFAAAIVLYQCLTQEQLFRRETEVATLTAILTGPVPRASALRPDVSPRLEAVLDRALAREMSDRFATAQEFQLALEGEISKIGRPATAAHLAAWLKELFSRVVPSESAEPNPMTPSSSSAHPWSEGGTPSPQAPAERTGATSPTTPLGLAAKKEGGTGG
ncbi:MAG: protein kinase domain-containing protein [Deltaproteobacteria bacterium]